MFQAQVSRPQKQDHTTAIVLMLVAGEAAIADDQVPVAAPPGVQCNDFTKLSDEALGVAPTPDV